MTENTNWQFELADYIRQGESDSAGRSAAWQTAIGLQAVDGLHTSDYLLQTAREHIEGKIDIRSAQKKIENYYEERKNRNDIEADTAEADIVSSRIAEILGERTFQFSPAEWQTVHRRLFHGVFGHAGLIRTYNITKKEWILKGETVLYASCQSIRDTMDYDFNTEKQFSYEGLSVSDAIKHIAKFTSDIWQIHPFCEGNTRATAVFIIKYLETFGLHVSNAVFAENSWYFRNALVRSNYNDLKNNIFATTKFLELFFENLLMDKQHDLKNRYLHIDYNKNINPPSSNMIHEPLPKCKNCTLNCTLEELAILRLLADNPDATQKTLAEKLQKSERTVKSLTVRLQEKGYLRRLNGKRNGHWEILINLNEHEIPGLAMCPADSPFR